MRAWITVLLLALTSSGCAVLQPGIPGSGNLQSEFRPVGPFHQVDLAGVGTVHVMVGQQPSVQVVTDDNLLPEVQTSVENGILKIRTRVPIRPQSGVNVNVTVPQLTALQISGVGELHAHGLSGDSIEMKISGIGSLTADGQVQHLQARISGAGSADLRDLVTQRADVRISGAGDATVFALDSLVAKVSGAGDVSCYGNPQHVDTQVSGAGDVEMMEDASSWVTIGDQNLSLNHDPQR